MGLRNRTAGVDDLSSTDVGSKRTLTDASSSSSADSKSTRTASGGRKALAGAKAGIEILNANYQLDRIRQDAITNIMLANYQIAQFRTFGAEQALGAETRGIRRGEEAALAAVTQGQSATGAIAESLRLEEETFGIYEAIAIEQNAIQNAFALRAEQSQIASDARLAELDRDLKVVGSLLEATAFIAGGA